VAGFTAPANYIFSTAGGGLVNKVVAVVYRAFDSHKYATLFDKTGIDANIGHFARRNQV
jgi:hypothetical protein